MSSASKRRLGGVEIVPWEASPAQQSPPPAKRLKHTGGSQASSRPSKANGRQSPSKPSAIARKVAKWKAAAASDAQYEPKLATGRVGGVSSDKISQWKRAAANSDAKEPTGRATKRKTGSVQAKVSQWKRAAANSDANELRQVPGTKRNLTGSVQAKVSQWKQAAANSDAKEPRGTKRKTGSVQAKISQWKQAAAGATDTSPGLTDSSRRRSRQDIARRVTVWKQAANPSNQQSTNKRQRTGRVADKVDVWKNQVRQPSALTSEAEQRKAELRQLASQRKVSGVFTSVTKRTPSAAAAAAEAEAKETDVVPLPVSLLSWPMSVLRSALRYLRGSPSTDSATFDTPLHERQASTDDGADGTTTTTTTKAERVAAQLQERISRGRPNMEAHNRELFGAIAARRANVNY